MTLDEGILWCKKNANEISSLEAALSTAWLDLWSLKKQRSIFDFFKSGNNMLDTSFTISIGDLELIPKKIEEAKTYNILKSKEIKGIVLNASKTPTLRVGHIPHGCIHAHKSKTGSSAPAIF